MNKFFMVGLILVSLGGNEVYAKSLSNKLTELSSLASYEQTRQEFFQKRVGAVEVAPAVNNSGLLEEIGKVVGFWGKPNELPRKFTFRKTRTTTDRYIYLDMQVIRTVRVTEEVISTPIPTPVESKSDSE